MAMRFELGLLECFSLSYVAHIVKIKPVVTAKYGIKAKNLPVTAHTGRSTTAPVDSR